MQRQRLQSVAKYENWGRRASPHVFAGKNTKQYAVFGLALDDHHRSLPYLLCVTVDSSGDTKRGSFSFLSAIDSLRQTYLQSRSLGADFHDSFNCAG